MEEEEEKKKNKKKNGQGLHRGQRLAQGPAAARSCTVPPVHAHSRGITSSQAPLISGPPTALLLPLFNSALPSYWSIFNASLRGRKLCLAGSV